MTAEAYMIAFAAFAAFADAPEMAQPFRGMVPRPCGPAVAIHTLQTNYEPVLCSYLMLDICVQVFFSSLGQPAMPSMP